MFNIRLTEVVKNLLIINILFYIGTLVVLGSNGDSMWALHHPMSENFRPYQIVTYMFMHSTNSFMHIAFNMLGLVFFGPQMESTWGAKRFLIFYLATGFGAAVFHFGLDFLLGTGSNSLVGASGSIVGIFTAFGLTYPNNRVMLLFPPIPMKAITMVMVFLGIDLAMGILDYVGVYPSNVAHFAHIGGALTAYIIMQIWKKEGRKLL